MNQKEQRKVVMLNEEILQTDNRIEELENDPAVREYLELVRKKEVLENKRYELNRKKEEETYVKCSHIFVKIDDGNPDFRKQRCVVCGLPLKKGNSLGLYTNITCDFALAQRVYNRIKKAFPRDASAEIAWKMKAAIKQIQESNQEQMGMKK